MEMSQDIKELSIALSKAQAVMPDAKKDSTNPYFNSKYASLSAVLDACRKTLGDNGLSVVQILEGGPQEVVITTQLNHVSGQWIRGTVTTRPDKPGPQPTGSATTYMRRYALQAMVGISADVDDDGEAASPKYDRGPQPDAVSAPKSVSGVFKVQVGKHTGKTYQWVVDHDPTYITDFIGRSITDGSKTHEDLVCLYHWAKNHGGLK
jgi:hypothetical protein